AADPAADRNTPVRKDLDRALWFVHFMAMQTKSDLLDATSRIQALTEELIAAGQVDAARLDERRKALRLAEAKRLETRAIVKSSDIVDKSQLKELPQIDCDARLHLCKAACCRLSFALSFQDVHERIVQWDYGQPYQIRKRPDGYCVHNDERTRGCHVYNH